MTTTRDEFEVHAAQGRVVPVIRDLFADGETPVGIYRKLAAGRPGTFLLESAEPGGIWSRYSFIGVNSFGVLTHEGDEAEWREHGLSAADAFGRPVPERPLEALRVLHERWSTPKTAGHPPLTGGLVGFIGWEAVRELEHLPNAPRTDYDIPVQSLSFVSELVVVDHHRGAVQLIATVLVGDPVGTTRDGSGADIGGLWRDAQARLDAMQSALNVPAEPFLDLADLTVTPTPTTNLDRDTFLGMVEKGKEYIREGDVFQVVLSQRFDHDVSAHPIDVYRVLRTLNPSPYMYLLALEDAAGDEYWVVGSSPEALVKVTEGRVYSHPIAGSRPRGDTPEHDSELATDLLADDKERSEHLMLVDLARNDLARVCEAGTVEVTEFMQIERFSHVIHMVSSVEGDLAEGRGPVDVFAATFPAGTLSGAPKPRALEIIDELEPSRRGAYGGVVGYFGFGGDLDLAITIRTMTISDGIARVQAGAGIVAESDPVAEYEETRAKAAAPLRAIAVANALRRVER